MEKKEYTVKEIAALTGYSVATVSRVINQNGRFSKETEEKIRKVIKETNYQPNHFARGLRTSVAKAVGVLVPDITNDFFAKIALEIQKGLFQKGYVTFVYNTNENVEIERQEIGVLQSQKIAGLVYISGNSSMEQSIEMPTVFIDRKPVIENSDNRSYVTIESDNRQGGMLAAQELLRRGCKRLACISFGESISTHNERIAGYCAVLRQHGIDDGAKRVIRAENATAESGYAETRRLLAGDPEIDGIFYTADVMAMGAYRAIRESGRKVPEQLKIIGFDGISQGDIAVPSLSTILQHTGELGRLAAELLLDMVNGKGLTKRNFCVPVEIVRRDSTG